jgi:FKBP-type peptidyl-prolyl cis-trans isomerase FkpA
MRVVACVVTCSMILLGAPSVFSEEEAAQTAEQPAAEKKEAATADTSEKAAPEPEAPATVTTKSGLQITTLREGTGKSPTRRDRVSVHYHGTFENGEVFDSSVDRGKPAVFPLNRVIKCWTEGLQLMKVGGKAKLVCPPKIAYGKRGSPPAIPPNATLTFEVEILAIQ